MADSDPKEGLKLLWLDPSFQSARPTTQSLYRALPFMLSKGWQMELWCLDHDAVDSRVKIVRLPRARFLRMLEPLWFWFIAGCRLAWRRLRGQAWAIVHTSGPDIPGADVVSLHFHNRTWIRLQWKEKARSLKERLKLLHTLIGVTQEALGLRSRRWKVILPVSEGLARRIRPKLLPEKKVRVLANVLDDARFNAGVREKHRQSMREQLCATAHDYLFIFVSTGHYHRKGLGAAVEVLRCCRGIAQAEYGLNLRLLVVGAGERAQNRLTPWLDQTAPCWRDWLELIPPTHHVEQWYAASDAFLFPSRYETFSLVALEASACGLPLLVTPYDGHEMYLRDGVNGCLLPWDLDGMKTRVAQFLRTERHTLTPGPASCIHASGYADILDQTYQEILSARSA